MDAPNYSKLSAEDLGAFVSAAVCHIEAQTTLKPENDHLVSIREAVDELVKRAGVNRFARFAPGGSYVDFVNNGGLRR